MKALSDAQHVATWVASGTYLRGFAAGADVDVPRRQLVDAELNAHWQRGYDDGRAAMIAGERRYEAEVVAKARAANEATP